MASPAIEPTSFANIAQGIRIELERLRDIAQDEIDRVCAEAWEGAHETMRAGLENRLRRRFRLDEIKAALAPEVPVPAGIEADGLVYYEDAAGQTWRCPVGHWVGFTAQRLYSVARQERARQFNAACRDIDPAEHDGLYARLTRELRIDALHALAFQSDKVFAAEEARRQGGEAPAPTEPRQDRPDLSALAGDMLDAWRVWSAASDRPDGDPEADAVYERAYDRRGELLDAAEALPATRDNLLPKALALAWIGYVHLWQRDQERADYTTDGRLAFDIHAAIVSAPTKPELGQPPAVSLVGQIDFASATLEELQAIHDTADMVGGVAYAAAWQSRCHRRGRDSIPNAAGEMMQWLGDALCDVETAAVEEARRRTPVNPADRETRLEILALPTIQNGELEGMAEFARALAAHAASRTREA